MSILVPDRNGGGLGGTPLGYWNANTNAPTLIDGTGNEGDYYLVSVAGTQDLGHGPITFSVNDRVIYSGGLWIKIDSPADLWQENLGDLRPINSGDNVNFRSGGLKDDFVTSAIPLGDAGNSVLNTDNTTIVGAINEVNAYIDRRETFTLDATDISNKYVTLMKIPRTIASITLLLKGAGDQIYGISYYLSGADIRWDGKDLDGQLLVGSVFQITYRA